MACTLGRAIALTQPRAGLEPLYPRLASLWPMEEVERLRRMAEEIKRVVKEDGGEATPARIKHRKMALSSLSENEIVELAKLSPELEVRRELLYPYNPSTAYYVIRLKTKWGCEKKLQRPDNPSLRAAQADAGRLEEL